MNEATPTPAEPTLGNRYDSTAVIVLQTSGEFVEKSALDLNYDLRRLESFRSIANNQTSNIESVKEYLIENYDELGGHADSIAELLDIELTREVEYTVTMTATVTVTIKPGDDADSLISDSLYIESNDSNVTVDDCTVDYTNEA
jgi:hypothetical protein